MNNSKTETKIVSKILKEAIGALCRSYEAISDENYVENSPLHDIKQDIRVVQMHAILIGALCATASSRLSEDGDVVDITLHSRMDDAYG